MSSDAPTAVVPSRDPEYRGVYFLFVFAFMSKLWAGPVAQQYKIHYISYFLFAIPVIALTIKKRLRSDGALYSERSLLLFFLYLTVSISWAYSPSTTAQWIAVDSLYLLVFWLAYVLFINLTEDRLARVFELIPFGVACVSIWALIVFGEVRVSEGEDFSQLGATSTILSFYLTAALPFLVRDLYLEKKLIAKLALLATIPLTFLLQSRAALGANLFVVVLTAIDFATFNRRRLLQTAAILGTVVVVVGIVFSTVDFEEDSLGGRLQHATTFSFMDAEEEFQHPEMKGEDLERRMMWFVAYQGFVEHPIEGIGYGGINSRFDDTFGYEVPSHGFVTTLLAETGLLGTVLFLFVMTGYFVRLGRGLKQSSTYEQRTFLKASRASMIGMLFVGLFHQVYQDQIFFILLAWGYASPERNRRSIPAR